MNHLKFIVNGHGKRTAVILPIKYYKQLLEDIHDLAMVAERRNEPTINFKELKRGLKLEPGTGLR